MASRRRAGSRWERALVTGASSGIGKAFAEQLARAGTDLVLVARRRDRLDALAEELTRRHHRHVEVLVADLVDNEQRATVEARLAAEDHPVDLLVNNAGFGSQGAFVDLPLDLQDEEVRLNVLAAVRLSHAVLPGMIRRGRGGILNVSSIASLAPLPYWATYSATKAFLSSFSLALREEVRPLGVNVLALCPGFTTTEFHNGAGMSRAMVPGPAWMSAESVALDGLRSLARGRGQRFPGFRSQILAALSRLTPRFISSRVVGAVGRRLPH